MSNDTPVAFELELDAHFEKRVRGGDTNPLVDVRIRVGSDYVLGSDTTVAGDYMTGHLIEELDALLGVADGRTQMLEFSDGPLFLVLEPVTGDRLKLVGCYDVDGTTPTDRIGEAMVPFDEWAITVIEVTKEYYKRICQLNPSLTDHSDVELLAERFESTTAALDLDKDSHSSLG